MHKPLLFDKVKSKSTALFVVSVVVGAAGLLVPAGLAVTGLWVSNFLFVIPVISLVAIPFVIMSHDLRQMAVVGVKSEAHLLTIPEAERTAELLRLIAYGERLQKEASAAGKFRKSATMTVYLNRMREIALQRLG